VLDCLQDVTVRPYQDQVAVASDELGDELAGTSLSVEVEGEDALPGGLCHVDQATATDPLAQQKQKGRRRLYTAARLPRYQKHARVLGIRGEEQLETTASVELQPNGALIGLHDSLHAGAKEPIQAVAKASQGQVVDVHRVPATTENVVAEGNDALRDSPRCGRELDLAFEFVELLHKARLAPGGLVPMNDALLRRLVQRGLRLLDRLAGLLQTSLLN
jgi:hypothetical protein